MNSNRTFRLALYMLLGVLVSCSGNVNNSQSPLVLTIRISNTQDGFEADSHSAIPSISDDGRYVAFQSDAPNLMPPGILESGPFHQIYVADVVENTLTLISTRFGGQFEGTGHSVNAEITGDGKYVVFQSQAEDLLSTSTTTDRWHVYRFSVTDTNDRLLVSTQSGLTTEANKNSVRPDISANGNVVIFESKATDLVFPYTTKRNIYIRRLQPLEPTLLVSTEVTTQSEANKPSGGKDTPHPYLVGNMDELNSRGPSISDDGRSFVFRSIASNLFTHSLGDPSADQIYLRTMDSSGNLNEDTALISFSFQNVTFANKDAVSPAISGDGRYVAFSSDAFNINDFDTNEKSDIFVRDTVTNTTEKISQNPESGQAASNDSGRPKLSFDGRYVTFASKAANLVENDLNELSDIFLFDQEKGTLFRVSVSTYGTEASSISTIDLQTDPAIAGMGRFIVYASSAPNLVETDGNDKADIFVSGPFFGGK